MLISWQGRGGWGTWIAFLAMMLPMIVLHQMDGPEVDRDAAVTIGVAAVAVLVLGLRWNRSGAPGKPARPYTRGLPMQIRAAAPLLGKGMIPTAEGPRQPRSAKRGEQGTLT